jgi:hypothetical protein
MDSCLELALVNAIVAFPSWETFSAPSHLLQQYALFLAEDTAGG